MRKTRFLWIILVILGYVMSGAHIALGILSMYFPSWISNDAGERRGLFQYCKDGGVCSALEMPFDGTPIDAVNRPILFMRVSQAGLIVGSMFINFVTMFVASIVLVCSTNPSIYMSPRTGQIVVCTASFFLWLSGIIHFVSFIIFHENLSYEVFTKGVQKLNEKFLLMNGLLSLNFDSMYIINWISCGCSFLASLIFMLAANLQKMPKFVLKTSYLNPQTSTAIN